MNHIEAMRNAVEAMDKHDYEMADHILCQAIAEAEKQEPVAWESVLGAVARGWCYEENANKTMDSELAVAIAKEVHALYTPPQQRKPLTDEQVEKIIKDNMSLQMNLAGIRQDFEAAHGITSDMKQEPVAKTANQRHEE